MCILLLTLPFPTDVQTRSPNMSQNFRYPLLLVLIPLKDQQRKQNKRTILLGF